ncbi:hypothetical protein MAPG_06800 [Magnaporthiopsis poae ATCC 64411]|uniref:Fibroin-3 n=1 Tax=Magnaporthiopsis poae (strain ATCC 64411 / 73-15) TaxID=644358 RepID=A0A0C4E307_MAGP6|nr:hypothetical protein MAPG_06800 [Magnaporthiopsis poae ATCC 64411]
MPSVNVAMERSLREGAIDLLAASIRPLLDRRAGTITESVSDVKTAFSSWDNCMKFTYCKWPVIALIIVGGLIIFSVVWCLVRCLCCGLSCCCQCFSCLKCCGNCCGCCDPPKGTPHKYLDDQYHSPTQGYRAQEPMNAGGLNGPKPPAPFAVNEPPKYAEFDVSKKSGNDDALPAMPSWEGSANQKVALEETVELDDLKKPESATANPSAQNLAMMAAPARGPATPANYRGTPYGGPGLVASASPYQAGRPGVSDPYAGNAQGYNNMNMNGGAYGQQDRGYQGYGAGGMAMGQGPIPPGNPANGSYGQGRGYPGSHDRQGSYDNYGRGATQGYGAEPGYGQTPASAYDQNALASPYGGRGPTRSPAPHQQGGYGYGDAPRRSPAPQADYGFANGPGRMASPQPDNGFGDGPRRTASPQLDYGYAAGNQGYGARSRTPQAQRKYSSDSTRPLNPQRQYSNGGAPSQPPLSPRHNTGGYGQDQGYGDAYAGRPKGPSRQNTGGGGGAYPGYQAYQPTGGSNSRAQQGWNGV